MVFKARDLTAKYRAFRHQPDPLYSSRIFLTFVNKFIKAGEKATARKHLYSALAQFRIRRRRPTQLQTVLRIFRRLRLHFTLASRRRGRDIKTVPVPLFRNKRDVLNLQALYNSIRKREERTLPERIRQELLALTIKPRQSSLLRSFEQHQRLAADSRTNVTDR